jgi:phosphinothricin acetyltransferase
MGAGRPDVRVRAAREQDLPGLSEIYNHYVRTSAITFDIEPQSVEQRREWLLAHPDTGPHRLLVATDEDRVLGYATSGPFRARPAYRTTVETSVYLDPGATGRGIGVVLYERLFAEIADEELHRAVAGVTLDVLWLEKPL